MHWVTCAVILVAGIIIAECQPRIPGDLAIRPDSPFAGPGGNLGDTICAFCMRMGWWECIQRWCFYRHRRPYIPGYENLFKKRRYIMRKPLYGMRRRYFRRRTPYRRNSYAISSYYRPYKKG